MLRALPPGKVVGVGAIAAKLGGDDAAAEPGLGYYDAFEATFTRAPAAASEPAPVEGIGDGVDWNALLAGAIQDLDEANAAWVQGIDAMFDDAKAAEAVVAGAAEAVVAGAAKVMEIVGRIGGITEGKEFEEIDVSALDDGAKAGLRRAIELLATKKGSVLELGDATTWFRAALVAGKLGWNEEAATFYKATLRHDPGHAMAWNNLGVALKDMKDLAWAGAATIVGGLWTLYASFRSQLWDYPYNVPPGELTLGQQILVPVIVLTIITLLGFSFFTWRLAKGERVHVAAKAITQTWAVFLIAGGITLVGVSAHYQFDTWLYDSSPYLTWTGTQDPSTGITVCWYAGVSDVQTVRYGTSPDNLSSVAGNGWPGQFHAVALEGLSPNTTYYYRAGRNPLKQFTTAPARPHSFTFAAWADPRQNDPMSTAINSVNLPHYMDSVLRGDRGIDVDFSVCLGDITSRGVDYETWKLWFEDITTADWASNRSHQIAIGNHERHDDCIAKNFERHYPYAKDEHGHFYYSFTYGHVHFIMLDPWDSTSCWWGGMTTTQLEWFESELAHAEASTTFTIVGVHPDPRPGGGHHSDLFNTQFIDVITRHRIDLVLCGHTHNFWSSMLNQTRVIRIGIGGNVYSFNNNIVGFSLLSVNQTAIHVETMYINGSVFDSTTITA